MQSWAKSKTLVAHSNLHFRARKRGRNEQLQKNTCIFADKHAEK